MALHINWLGEEQMIELDMQSSEKGQGRESLQSPLVLPYSVLIAIIIIYAITHTDYTQYINTCIYLIHTEELSKPLKRVKVQSKGFNSTLISNPVIL